MAGRRPVESGLSPAPAPTRCFGQKGAHSVHQPPLGRFSIFLLFLFCFAGPALGFGEPNLNLEPMRKRR